MFMTGYQVLKSAFITPFGTFLLSLSLLMLSSGCAINPVTGKSQIMLISESQEIAMGRDAAPSLNWDFGGRYRDRELESYLGGIVGRLWSVSERSNLPFSFYVQNTSIPNAFALPGYVAMTRGLLVNLQNEAQFSAIMGHEAGHVMARHTAARVSRGVLVQVGLGLGGAALGSTRGGDALMALGSVGASLLLLQYDRSQELESDRLGVLYMSKIGYDPGEAVTAHEELVVAVDRFMKRAGKESASGGFLDSILSTHPRKEVRVEEIRNMISELPPYRINGDGRFAADFSDKLRGIRKTNEAYLVYDDGMRALEQKSYAEADRLVRKAIAMNEYQAPFHALAGRIAFVQERFGDAEKGFQKALSIDNEYQPAYYGLGVIAYRKNDYRKGLEHLEKSLTLYPQHPGSLYASGLCYHELNMPQEALTFFGSFAGAVEEHPEVYGYMGMDYEKMQRVDLAMEAYTAQIKVEPNNRMGAYAKQRLAELKKTSTGK